MRVHADLEACQGYLTCLTHAPEVFDIDDDEGKVRVLQNQPSATLRSQIEAAVRSCPARALALTEE